MSNMANKNNLGYIGKKPDAPRNSDSWYTPPKYIESVRLALNGITLDPFSSDHANETVKASFYFDEFDDGLCKDWNIANETSVFMNPPYSGKMVKKSIQKFLSEYELNNIQSGIILVNNATETKWFQSALAISSSLCFTDHRIGFWNDDGKRISNNTRGQVFLHFGNDFDLFETNFKQYGTCIKLR